MRLKLPPPGELGAERRKRLRNIRFLFELLDTQKYF